MWRLNKVRHKAGRHGDSLEELKIKRREHESALRRARRDRQLVSRRLLLIEDEDQTELSMDAVSQEQDVVCLFLKIQHSGPEREASVKALSKALRDPSAQLTFIKLENSMHLLVSLLTGSNAQCRLQAVRCLHELSHSPHADVTPACLPATSYLLTYLSGQSSKFTQKPQLHAVHSSLEMEGTEPANNVETTGRHANQESDNMVLKSTKPLHRFVQRDPKSLGIVIVIFGCAEFLMGFHLAVETMVTSYGIYVPFWQGALFIISGSLSIYTVGHPSKKMVTVCFAMYLISFFGIIVSFGYRINLFSRYQFHRYWWEDDWTNQKLDQLLGIECVMFTSSLCVGVLLIFLCCVARLALKSTQTQVIVQCIPPPTAPPQSNVTAN